MHRLRRHAEPDVNTALAKRRAQLLGDEGLLARDEPVERLHDRHRRPKLAVGLRHFNADHPAAEHDQTGRDRSRRGDLVTCPRSCIREAGIGGTAAVLPTATTTALRAS